MTVRLFFMKKPWIPQNAPDEILRMKRLRSGYTTIACAAAAAKAAALMLSTGEAPGQVTIPFPDGSRVSFSPCTCQWSDSSHTAALAAVIKDAGDDPDVTNGARIIAEVRFAPQGDFTSMALYPKSKSASCEATARRLRGTPHATPPQEPITLINGHGVGTVTKPGLAIAVGEPAINPIPRQMIREAVTEALAVNTQSSPLPVIVTISIPNGAALATKTLNHRLGIIGGLSILGTTGIVRPVSAEAWTATISASMSVACGAGIKEIVLSTGRTSESAVQQHLGLADEALVMMGDYLHFSLLNAKKYGFTAIHLAAMWAKVLKAAMRIPQTHVRHGALEAEDALSFLATLGTGASILQGLGGANTAREIYERLIAMESSEALAVITKVCGAARDYGQEVSGLPVTVHLVNSSRRVVATISGTSSS